MSQHYLMVSTSRDFLRLNVGFIVHQTVGYSREFPFDFPSVYLPPDLHLANLTGIARVTRTAQGLLVQCKMQASVLAECARCLESFSQPLVIDCTELYAFSQNSVTESGLIMPESGKINLAPIVRDEMLLSVPINPLCRADCKGLCPICGENLNLQSCNHEEDGIDPRLSVLKSLIKD